MGIVEAIEVTITDVRSGLQLRLTITIQPSLSLSEVGLRVGPGVVVEFDDP